MHKLFNLQRFTDGEDGGENKGGAQPEIDYEKLASIINGKQTATEDSVLRGYFKQQGMSKEDMETAIANFKDKKKENDPNIKLAEAQAELEKLKNENIISKKDVAPEYSEFVMFKARQVAKDKNIAFEKAVDSVLKDNPIYKKSGAYRVSTGTQSGGSEGSEGGNAMINDAIRNAFRR